MTTAAHKSTHRYALPRPHVSAAATTTTQAVAARYVFAVARISLGWIFLWAFIDKMWGLGHETTTKQAWIHGGSPTKGFLKMAAAGPLKGFYNSFAGATWANYLFMTALAGIGIALIAGIGMRIAATSAVLLLVMMWSAVLPPTNNIFIDDHLIYTA